MEKQIKYPKISKKKFLKEHKEKKKKHVATFSIVEYILRSSLY